MRGRCRCSHLIVDRITLIVVGLVVAFAPLSARAQTAVFVPFASRRDVAHDPVRNLLYIASGSTGTVARYDLGTGQFLTPFNVGGQPVRLDISPDNGRLAVADQLSVSTINGYTSSAAVIDLATGGITRAQFTSTGSFADRGVSSVAFANDGSLLLTTSSDSTNGSLRRYPAGGGAVTTLRSDLGNLRIEPNLAHDHIALVEVGSSGGRFGIWRASDGSFVRSEKDTHLNNVKLPGGGTTFGAGEFTNGVAINPAASQIAIDGNLDLHLYNLNRSLPQQYLWAAEPDPAIDPTDSQPFGVAYSPDGKTLYVAWGIDGGHSAVYAHDTTTFAVTAQYPIPVGFITDGIGGGNLQPSASSPLSQAA